ncbi:MAG: hypothetical protein WBC07_08470 [Methylotenera sp.]
MFDIATARQVFAEKLARENNFDAAFVKAVWVAYKAGHKDAGGLVIYTNGITDSFIEINKNANA